MLIEAMMAVVIIGMVLTPLFMLEFTIFEGVGSLEQKVRRYWYGTEYLYETRRTIPRGVRSYNAEKIMKDPYISLKYSLGAVAKNSSLKNEKQLFKEQVRVISSDKKNPETSIIRFVCIPEQEQS